MCDGIPPEKRELARCFHAATDQLPSKLSIMDMSVFFCGLMDGYGLTFPEKKDLILLMANAIAARNEMEEGGSQNEKLH